jgi:hypothetical protein
MDTVNDALINWLRQSIIVKVENSMSENLFYYLEKNGVHKKDWEKIAKATAEWLESRKNWFGDGNPLISLLLAEKPFSVNVKGEKVNE